MNRNEPPGADEPGTPGMQPGMPGTPGTQPGMPRPPAGRSGDVIATKLFAPRSRQPPVYRPRLHRLLDGALTVPLTLVGAG